MNLQNNFKNSTISLDKKIKAIASASGIGLSLFALSNLLCNDTILCINEIYFILGCLIIVIISTIFGQLSLLKILSISRNTTETKTSKNIGKLNTITKTKILKTFSRK